MSKFVENLGLSWFFFAAFFSTTITFAVIYILIIKTYAFFQIVSLGQFFLDTVWSPFFVSKHFGIWALVCGSFLVTSVAMIVASFFGIFSAIYLSEYARPGFRKILKPSLEILSGIPTIVYGYFALSMVTPYLKNLIPSLNTFNALSAGITMGVMLIPLVSSLSEDAMYKTPKTLREAAFSLGASKIDIIFYVVLPYAKSAIISSLFLAFSRAMGESMIVSIAAGLTPDFSFNILKSIQTMTAFIVQVSMGDIPQDSLEYVCLFAVASMLFLITFMANIFSKMALRTKAWKR